MGRAYEVRKASIQKTGAAKAKLYSMYAKEIYQAAKTGGVDPVSNVSLKRLIDKAKKDQIPGDIIKRALDKVTSGVDESYVNNKYELFGNAGTTIIVDCLTDNVNRTLSDLRTVLNKANAKMGAVGSVAYMYEHVCMVGFKGLTEEEVLEALIENDVEMNDLEIENDIIIVYGEPNDLFKIKHAIQNIKEDIEFEYDEITMFPKDKITLEGENLNEFNKLLTLLEDIEDVQNVYHNVELA